ncbi:MAG: NADH-quinone oxidoreductase subunit K [Gemmatimonadetes bacterium 13_1_40CM_70_11]|nr:MAG: NADH-quinone oxidoreductase subunit K [Gemmatimonadetes bacterium 13_1_40CM_70_11]
MMLLGPSLFVSAVLFTLGVGGVLLRRNAIVIFMCVELMLNAVNLTFIALAQTLGVAGQIFVFFVMAVAAAEAAVGLAIILAIYRHRATLNLERINLLKG